MKPTDRFDAMIKKELQLLKQLENRWNRKEIQSERKRLKNKTHKLSRSNGKREIDYQLCQRDN